MSVIRGTLRSPGRAVVSTVVLILSFVAPVVLVQTPAQAATGSAIVAAARSQAGYKTNPYGSNCNKFTAYWGVGSDCGNGNRSEAWCADFAAWAWAQAGITGLYGHGISGAASSFRTWGQATGRWHPLGDGYAPQPGDVAEYSDAHVGIYSGGSATSPTVINGNWWYPDTGTGQVYEQSGERTNGDGAALSGYVSAPTDGASTPPPSNGVGTPGPIVALTQSSRIDLSWGAAANATGYQVWRDGQLIAQPSGSAFRDSSVSADQTYTYSIAAVGASGTSPAVTARIQNSQLSAYRAFLTTKSGPAECGLAGDQTHQALVCNVLTSNGWISASDPAGLDWGYPDDRAWIANTNGTASYCRTVGTGNQLKCSTFTGTKFTTTTTSNPIDPGYGEPF